MGRGGKSTHELRCFCSREPLLALYGVGSDGLPYIHIKVYKQTRIYGEAIIKGGEVKLHCRECLRWHRVVIRAPRRLELEEAYVDPIHGKTT